MNNIRYGTPLYLLNKKEIFRAVNNNYLQISPFNELNVQPSGYDVGIDKIAKFRKKDFYLESDTEEIFEDFSELFINPGDAYLFSSLEVFDFPIDMIGRIGLRSRYCRILNSAESLGRIENGWKGKIILEISNRSQDRILKLHHGEPIASIEIFHFFTE